MLSCVLYLILIDSGVKLILQRFDGIVLKSDVTKYQSIVGSEIYLA